MRDRVAVIGQNGTGKTTLFEIISGNISPDSGVISIRKGTTIGYLKQDINPSSGRQLLEEVAKSSTSINHLSHKIQLLQEELTEEQDKEDIDVMLRELGELQHAFEASGGYDAEHEARIILSGLGFAESDFSRPLSEFSGGWRIRVELAKLLFLNPDLLILDEPTNHLDIESTRWLEEYLQATDRSFIVVSHDRSFLAAATAEIWELRFGKLEFYSGGLEKYLTERAARRTQHEHLYRHQQAEIKRLEEFVRRNMAGQKTKQAQSKLKYLDRIKRLDPPRGDGRAARIDVTSSGRSWAHLLAVDDLSLGYGANIVVRGLSFDVYRGDKVGIIGRNGSGKSTLLKTLVGQLAPARGEIRLGHQVEVAYFDQELSDLNPESTVLDSLWEMDPQAVVGKIRSYLARFGFSDEDPFKLISSLSGGEKTKLSLARLLYHPANFIIFDEPTNHLDMDSRERLEEALIEYDGSCLIVSHDRYFLDKVVGRVLYLKDGAATVYDGNYAYFREKTEAVEETPTVRP
ncbi:MAG: ABC-F family ATP-binding cassette domain-containing protein, partial [candidate division Zixibacteria bacterium]|nr:ABC-F family ATP-binding cassette domain-containing protein [candidate division Zixibacteria bacterium]